MEHEDNAHLDNYLQNSQHLMENLQIASGGGVRGDVGAEEIGMGLGIGNIGGKFEEHEEQDDEEEWKYIKEVQQSEKQQTKVVDGKEVVEGVGNSNSNGNGNIDAGYVDGDEMLLLDRHEHEAGDGFGNGVADVAVAAHAAHAAGDGFCVEVSGGDRIDGDEEGEVEIIKNDGDFSTTSNTTSTPGEEDADAAAGVLQVDVKIEAAEQMPQLQAERLTAAFGTEETEEEEPSSLATNTTNGTNSLSENVPPQQLHELQHEELEQHEQHERHEQQQQQQHDYNFDLENKENADPLLSEHSAEHPTDFEMHSQLNPDAREFVPSFGSNPSSPTLPGSSNPFDAEDVGEPAFDAAVTQAELLQPHPSAVPRHLLGNAVDDDFVALSPRKGRGETNMEGISLPAENEFEDEAAKRPHELEQEANLMAGVPLQQSLLPEVPLGHLDNLGSESAFNLLGAPDTTVSATEDALDFQRQSPASFIDHGPETSVDLDADIDEQPSEVLKQTELAGKSGESIEQLLNTVQPLPTDSESLNASFTDEGHQQEPAVGEKELLDVEEKEHISHSPSTEEMQMNLDYELHASAKDIPQIPTDLDNVEHMQDSIYLEHTSSDAQQQAHREQEQQKELHSPEPQQQPQSPAPAPQSPQPQSQSQLTDESLLIDTSIPIESDVSFEAMRAAPVSGEADSEAAPQTALNIFAPEFMPMQKLTVDATPSPQSTEEKHLVEETKEEAQAAATNITGGLDELEQKMDDLILSAKDGILSQVEKVAETATHIFDNFNPFATQESEHNAAEFMTTEKPQLTPTFVPEVKAEIPEPELRACQYAALNEQVAEAVKTAADDAFAPVEAEPLKEAFVEEPIPAVEPPVVAAVEKSVAAEPTTTAAEPITAAAVELAAEPASEPAAVEPAVIAEEKSAVQDTAVAVGAVAATAAAAAATVALAKKADSAKKPASRTPTSAKSKLGEVKKAAPAKKPAAAATTTAKATTTSTTTARPRTAPAHKPPTTAAAEKKAPITARTSTTTTTRKPLSTTTTTTRTTTTRTTTARPATAPTAASKTASTTRPTTSSTARRVGTTTTAASAPKANGTAAKPGTTSSAPTKPTTLGLSGTTKPRLSPRATLTSQLRKTVPGATTTSTARSPSKGTTPTTNGTHTVTKSSTTTAASRTKTTPVSTTTTTTKTFTARPAPRTTLSTTTTTRRTVGGTPGATTTTRTSSTLLKRTPPSKTGTTPGRLSLSPTKTSTTALKTKTKEATKKATPTKTGAAASALKQKHAEEKTNGAGAAEVQQEKVQQPQLNGGGEPHVASGHFENGTHSEGQQNGGALDQGFLAEPQQQQQQPPTEFSLIDA